MFTPEDKLYIVARISLLEGQIEGTQCEIIANEQKLNALKTDHIAMMGGRKELQDLLERDKLKGTATDDN